MTGLLDGPTYAELEARLREAEQTLEAIHAGEVDAMVVSVDGGVRIYTLEGADAFYRGLIEQMPEGAAAVSADGQVLYANSRCAAMLGVPLESLMGAELPDFVRPFQRERLRELLTRKVASEAVDLTLMGEAGIQVPVAVSVQPLDGHEEGTRCVVIVDLTRRRLAEAALREAEARFRGAFDNAPIGMALLDLGGHAEKVNSALCAIARISGEDLLGHQLPWLTGKGETIDDTLLALLSGEIEKASIERCAEHPGGRTVWAAIHLTLLRGAGGQPQHFIAQVQDVSGRRRHLEQLRHVADHDGLTGLLNRRGFEQVMGHHLAVTARYGVEGALILLDIDHFKYINDTRGHHVGDRVLAELGEKLRERLRDSDVIARLGGDEFAILLPRGDPAAARTVGEQLVVAAHAVDIDGLSDGRGLTVSVGVVAVDDSGRSTAELMALADLALYDSKEAGRDRATVYDASDKTRTATGSRLTWLGRIEEAIAQGSLMLATQPIVSMASGTTVQEELLVRLPGPDGPVAAGVWFPVAERYGLATAVDEWVVDRAFDLLLSGDHPALSINVSATSIGSGALHDRVRDGLARTGVEASRLTFEITEAAAIGNIGAAIRFTEGMQALGCRLALDDFGAGFGSFYYLKHLPFDDVKIDGEFISDCVNNPRDQAIIRAMVDMASSMGRRTVAEFIEDAETLEFLQGHGVDLAQGYHVGRPLEVDL